MVIGPTRSGKGTIGRVLSALLGAENVAGPSFASLATNFGGQSLIGKALAVVGDARLSGRSDQAVIVERLLSISGEDRITVDRKHRLASTGTLPTRLMLLSNEVPELRDASLALANRLLILKLTRTFLGREDTELTSRLMAELPGILTWAVAGWARLHGRKAFVMPESGRSALRTMEELSSPVSAFVDDCCEVDPQHEVISQQLHEAYQRWCEQRRKRPLDHARFGRDLFSAVASVRSVRRKVADKKVPHYLGIALRTTGGVQGVMDLGTE